MSDAMVEGAAEKLLLQVGQTRLTTRTGFSLEVNSITEQGPAESRGQVCTSSHRLHLQGAWTPGRGGS